MVRIVVRAATLSFLLLLLIPTVALAQVSLTTIGSPTPLQTFDTLINTGSTTWTNNSTIPGWFHARTGTGTTIVANDGSSNAGNLYSYGTGTATDRALGSLGSGNAAIGNLFWGVRLQNNTGATITQLDVQYVGEQWRNSAAAAQTVAFSYLVGTPTVTGSLAEFQSAGVAVPAGDFTSPITGGAAGALNGNLAANRITLTFSITGLSIPNGTEVMLRWSDPDHTGADHGLAIDDFVVTPQGAAPNPPVVPTCPATLSTTFGTPTSAPVSATDSNGTVISATITGITPSNPGTITLTGFTPAGGVGGTANATLNVSNTTPVGSYNVTIQWANNDGVPQTANCVVGVNVTAPVVITLIHNIQGNGASSPVTGSNVNIKGIVTGVKSNGFFVQEEDVDADADPTTSEGIFVFTSSAPPAAAAFTAQVQVNGTVSEFVPGTDPQQPPLTELSGTITVSQTLAPGQPLPAAITLTATCPAPGAGSTCPGPTGNFDQLERYEGMRVSAASMTVVGPSDGTVNEANATGTSNGRFHAVVTGVARPFREPGVQQPDTVPVGTIPPIPRWDTNPERLRVESASINSQPALTVKSSDAISAMVGPLDYGFRGYAIYPDGTLTLTVTPGTLNTMVTTPLPTEFTIASYNLERFFDTVNDPESDAVLTATAFNNRLLKASIAIRTHLKYPDIIGVQEMEHLSTLQALATQINNDAVTLDALPNPMYVAYLTEGNDVGGIDVGYLVKTVPVPGGAPRVFVNSVTQVGAATTYIDPTTGSPATLNDRPPLVLDAIVNRGPGASIPVIVINNHLRSLLGLTDETPSGPTTTGDRVRRKRQIQADFLAQYIQGRLTATPGEHIIVIGDMNNFEFNDGYQDSLDTIAGTPVPDNETVVCSTCPVAPNTGDGIDQLNPNLVNLVNTPPAPERYSYNFEGNVQNIDHALVSAGLVTDTAARRIEHPRIDADYPETERNTNTTAFRTSDHDPVVAYFAPLAFTSADLDVTKSDSPDPVNAGTNLTYTITVTNSGPDPATTVAWSDPIPTGTTFFSLSSVAGWTCSDPGVGNNGIVSCSNPTVAVGSSVFTLVVHVNATVAAGTVLSNPVTLTSPTSDPDSGDRSATEMTTVAASADLQISKSDSPDPVFAGSNITYQMTITNFGPSNAASATFSDPLPPGTTFVSLSTTGPWSCSDPGVGNNGTVSCTNPSFGVTVDFFTIVVNVPSATANGTVLTNTATVGSSTTDPNGGNESATATTTVTGLGVVSGTKAWSGTRVQGSNITYTVTLTNNMFITQPDNATDEFVDVLPASLTLVSANATSGTPFANIGLNTVTWNGSLAPSASVTITIVATINASASGTVSNQGTINFDANGSGDNESSGVTDDPTTGAANDPTNFNIVQANVVEVTKAVSGTFVQGTNVTYTIVMTNNMTVNQPDNFGHEFTDILPAGLTLIPASFTATSGTTGSVSNIFFWDGSIPSGGTVTLTFAATISPTATGTICNQGQSIFDKDGDNQNEASELTDDPSTGAVNDPTCFTVLQANVVEVTKAVSGTFVQGTNVTYTIVLTNNMTVTQPNNFGHEFTDILPAGLTLVPASFTATSGTNGSVSNIFFWDGSIPSGGTVTLTFQATISPTASGQICNQGQSIFDKDGDGQNESSELTDDPSTAAGNDPTCFYVVQANIVEVTKAVSGTFVQGTNVTYTIVLTNNMTVTQPNNFGHEFTDNLPPGLTLVSGSFTATSGTTGSVSNIFFWDGSIPSGGTVTLTFAAMINPTATGQICNQGQSIFDRNGDGQNEASELTDDPSTVATNDPTCFNVIVQTDSDGDGVDDTIEQGAPNGGDGNGDGIPDFQQGTVASIPAATGSGYLTLQSSCQLQQVSVTTPGTNPPADPGFHYPHGLISFRAPCSSATFSLFVYGSGAASAYRKFGPLPPGGPQQWYPLPGATFSNATVGSLHPRRVDFSLTDGGTGDDTPVDGVIVDQGGPAAPFDIPTLSQWALIALAMALAAFGALRLKA